MGYKIVRAVLDFIFFVIFRLHVEGRENVPPDRSHHRGTEP